VPDTTNLTPYLVTTAESDEGLFTGYYEPELKGSFTQSEEYPFPLYSSPHPLIPSSLQPFFSRAEIESGALANQNFELIWCADKIDVFFLHIQGSGKIILPDGTIQRVGFAAKNGHPYTAIGKVLREAGNIQPPVTMQKIKAYLREHPDETQDILNRNASYNFFKLLDTAAPVGASGIELIPQVSLAIDNTIWPYGLDVIVATRDPVACTPLNLRMITHDTGSAITGAIRGDIFFGSGDTAAHMAGAMAQKGRMFVVLEGG
jgi:membrane-bound lytic murein transglycosylase A